MLDVRSRLSEQLDRDIEQTVTDYKHMPVGDETGRLTQRSRIVAAILLQERLNNSSAGHTPDFQASVVDFLAPEESE